MTADPTGTGRNVTRAAAGLFLAALLARLAVLLPLHTHPLFGLPIVDAASYVDQARALAAGAPVTEALFWQPIFYPLWLSLVFRAFGPSLLAARILQALPGATACVLVYLFARRAGGRRAAIAAGLILAFYGPVIALETDLLSEGWAVFWAAFLLWGFTRAPSDPRPLSMALLGAGGGLAILTRPTFLPFVAGAALWLILTVARRNGGKAGMDKACTLALGLLLILLPAAAFCRQHTGRFTILPSSSGLNLYLGNNPRWVETVSIRPGVEWMELIREPQREGRANIWDQSDYFRGKVRKYARTGAFASGLLRKTARLFCSREIPRNHDLYSLREAAPVLKPLLWKAGGFGFPFGLLLPLALLGLATRGRQLVPAWLFLLLYPPAVIAVFVSDRYRAPAIPALAVAAAFGLAWLWDQRGHRRRLGGAIAALAAAAILISLPRAYPEERLSFGAERNWAAGQRLAEEGRPAEAESRLRRATELDPGMVDAWNSLGVLLERQGRRAEAIDAYRRALALDPGNAGLRFNLEAARLPASGSSAPAAGPSP